MYLAPTRTERSRGSLGRLPLGKVAVQLREGLPGALGALEPGVSELAVGQGTSFESKISPCRPCSILRLPAGSPLLPRQKHGANKIVFTPRRNLTSAAAPAPPRPNVRRRTESFFQNFPTLCLGGRGGRRWLDFRKLVSAGVGLATGLRRTLPCAETEAGRYSAYHSSPPGVTLPRDASPTSAGPLTTSLSNSGAMGEGRGDGGRGAGK